MKHLGIVAFTVFALAACNNKKKEEAPAPSKGSAGAMTAGSAGSAAWGSDAGSAMGSAMMSGSAMGSGMGSAMSGSAMGSAAMAGSAAGSGMAAAGADSFHWDAMSHEQRMDYMKNTVVPTMKPLFQQFDAKHYANFGCKTCHGKDPKKTKFKMPTPDLPKLDFAALKAGKQKPEVAKWMGEVVKPQMAKLMHEPEYTEANPKGFGCLECHEEKK